MGTTKDVDGSAGSPCYAVAPVALGELMWLCRHAHEVVRAAIHANWMPRWSLDFVRVEITGPEDGNVDVSLPAIIAERELEIVEYLKQIPYPETDDEFQFDVIVVRTVSDSRTYTR